MLRSSHSRTCSLRSPLARWRRWVTNLLSFSYSSEKDTKGFVATIKENPVHSGGQQQAAMLTGRCCDTFAPLSTTLRGHQLLSIDYLCQKSESASTWLEMELLARTCPSWICWHMPIHHGVLKRCHPSVNPSLPEVLCHRFLK